MDSSSMDEILREAGMLLENDAATNEMKKSIYKFASLLQCPLCNKIFDRPATLVACGHTFCMNCIDEYSSKNCDCPAEGCGMPLSMVRGNAGSFRTPNLQISQTIESLQLICKSLNQSEKNWWLSPNTLQSIQEKKSSKMKEKQDVLSEASEGGEDNSEDDGEMIDLQANEDEQSWVSLNTVDDKKLQGSDGNTSEDESLWVVVKGRSSFENNDTSLTVK